MKKTLQKPVLVKLLHSVSCFTRANSTIGIFRSFYLSFEENYLPKISDWVLSRDFFVLVITTNTHIILLPKKPLFLKSQKNFKEKQWFVSLFNFLMMEVPII